MQISDTTNPITEIEQKLYKVSLWDSTAVNRQFSYVESEVDQKIRKAINGFISSTASIGFVEGIFTALENKWSKQKITAVFKQFESANLSGKIVENKALIELEVQRYSLLKPRSSHLIRAFYEVTGLLDKNPRLRPNTADRFIYVIQKESSVQSKEPLLQAHFERINGQLLVDSKKELHELTTTLERNPGYSDLSSLVSEAIQQIDKQFGETLEKRAQDAVRTALDSSDFLPLFSLWDKASAFGKAGEIENFIQNSVENLKKFKDQLILTYKFRLYESRHENKPKAMIATWLARLIENEDDEETHAVANQMSLSNEEALFFAIHNKNLTKVHEIFETHWSALIGVKDLILKVAEKAKILPMLQSSALLIPSIFEKTVSFQNICNENYNVIGAVELLRIVVFAEVKMKSLYEKSKVAYFKKKKEKICPGTKLATQEALDSWNTSTFNLAHAVQYDPQKERYFVFINKPMKGNPISVKVVRLACQFFLTGLKTSDDKLISEVIELSAHYNDGSYLVSNTERVEGIRKEYQYAQDDDFQGPGLPPKPIAFLKRPWRGNEKESLFVEKADGDIHTKTGEFQGRPILIYTLASDSIDGLYKMHTHRTKEGVSDPRAHFDIKRENIVLTMKYDEETEQDTYHFYLIDFETACKPGEKVREPCDKRYGTLEMTPPEMISTDRTQTGVDYLAADVWALGHTLYEVMFNGSSFVRIPNYLDSKETERSVNFKRGLVEAAVDQAHKTLHGYILQGKYLESIADLLLLVLKMLHKNPKERITIEQVKEEFDSIHLKHFPKQDSDVE